MFGNSQLSQSFAAQFSGEGADIVYRRDSRAAPIRVSAAERDAFIAGFRRATQIIFVGMMVAIFLLTGAVVWLGLRTNTAFDPLPLYVGIGLIAVAGVAGFSWALRAPARALQYRASSGQALTRQQVERAFFERLTYTQLLAVPVVAGLLLMNVSRRTDVLHGWGLIWLAVFAAFILLAVVQGARKWRYEAAKKRG